MSALARIARPSLMTNVYWLRLSPRWSMKPSNLPHH
jgi:hypothetical protein